MERGRYAEREAESVVGFTLYIFTTSILWLEDHRHQINVRTEGSSHWLFISTPLSLLLPQVWSRWMYLICIYVCVSEVPDCHTQRGDEILWGISHGAF